MDNEATMKQNDIFRTMYYVLCSINVANYGTKYVAFLHFTIFLQGSRKEIVRENEIEKTVEGSTPNFPPKKEKS